jgi:hypothetical protein
MPTRGYRVLCHDATLIDLEAEGIWPMGTQLEFTITTLVIGLPRQVVVRRCRRADVDLVLRDDGAVWPPLTYTCKRPGNPDYGRGGWCIGSAPGPLLLLTGLAYGAFVEESGDTGRGKSSCIGLFGQ